MAIGLSSVIVLSASPAAGGGTCFGRVPTILGSTGDDDNLLGTPGDDVIHSRGGTDWVYGRGGNDRICGGEGENYLFGGDGKDRLRTDGPGGGSNGQGGSDFFKNGTVRFDKAPSRVVVDLDDGTARGWGDDRLEDVRRVIASEFDDILRGSSKNEYFYGAEGADVIHGRGGADFMSGETFHPDGNDEFYGGGGADRLFATRGDDLMNGGAGVDTIQFDMDAGVNVNLQTGRATGGGRGGTDRLKNLENVEGSIYDDRIIGDDGPNTLDGFYGLDTIRGVGDSDTLEGSTGNDQMFGGEGPDYIYGQTDDDTMFGGDGADYIDGEEGSDYADGQAEYDVCLAETIVNCEA